MKTCPSCGAEAPDDAVTCAACGKPFEAAAAAPAAGNGAAPPAPEAGKPAAAAPEAQEITLSACPQCKTAWRPGAVLCLSCGYDARVGRQLPTVHGVEDEGPILRQTAGLGPVRVGVMLHALRSAVLLAVAVVATVVAVYAVQIQNTETFQQPTQSLEEKRLSAESGEKETPAAQTESAPAGPDYGAVQSALVLSYVAFSLALAAPVLGAVGSVLCLRAPPRARARHWAALALIGDVPAILALAGLFAWGCWLQTSTPLEPTKTPPPTDLAGWPLYLALLPAAAAWVLFIVFAAKMGRFYERQDEAAQAPGLVVSGLIALLLIPMVLVPQALSIIVWVWPSPIGAAIGYFVGAALGLAWFLFGLWLTVQVFGLANAVRRALAPAAPAAAPAEAAK